MPSTTDPTFQQPQATEVPKPASPAAPPILELSNVGTAVDDARIDAVESPAIDVSLVLRAGDLAIVRPEGDVLRTPLADLACGIVEPTAGVVRFCGQDWQRVHYREASRQRGRIGRVFDGGSWIANLDVDENVMLASRHHGRGSDTTLAADADALARQYGFTDGLPRTRPQQTSRSDLARAAIVRAFMGEPALLLLERPEQSLSTHGQNQLAAAVAVARKRGAAVLWLTSSPLTVSRYDYTDDSLPPVRMLAFAAGRLTEEPAAASGTFSMHSEKF